MEPSSFQALPNWSLKAFTSDPAAPKCLNGTQHAPNGCQDPPTDFQNAPNARPEVNKNVSSATSLFSHNCTPIFLQSSNYAAKPATSSPKSTSKAQWQEAYIHRPSLAAERAG